MAISNDDNGEQSLVPWKRGMDSVASAALATVLASGEGSCGRVLKRSYSLDPRAFSSFSSSLGVGCP